MERRLTVKVTVGLSILTFERHSDLGYLGLRLCLKYISNWNSADISLEKWYFPTVTTKIILMLRDYFTVLLHCNEPIQNLLYLENCLRIFFFLIEKLTLNSSLVMNDNTTEPLCSGLQDSRGRLKHITSDRGIANCLWLGRPVYTKKI